ncbi:glycosyltransferase family 2 protein [Chitinophaga pendula]|uniref:glycosyltransferase n=1 Tax=Chitinophaga TaxID=79328 RepID=UPI000BAE9B6C|nr:MULTISPECIES: glycosyltransferase [Chitinophaga]ASZ12315.1 N-glycosyltransferase [Chitinophaga sp. MD30]UCJ10093.1 glycosyltransferase family 2 protein [Chitinophaga pendula]
MYFVQLFIQACSTLLFIYFGISVCYLFVLSVAGRLIPLRSYSPVANKKRILVLIPSYKEDHIIVSTARKAAAHDYPADHFQVVVIADQLQAATVDQLRQIPVAVVVVSFETSMKSRSLHAGLHQFAQQGFDMAVVLDADNVMGAGSLELINGAFQQGHAVIQCHRTAKNRQTAVALLDGISEEINNHIFRTGQRALGLPAALIGSGIAFRYALLMEILDTPGILSNPGEDREIDIQLLRRRIDVAYITAAQVYDEKVSSQTVFEKQRVRWLEAQAMHIRRFFSPELRALRFTRVYLHKLFQCLLLPRLLYISLCGGILLLLLTQELVDIRLLFPATVLWLSLVGIYFLTLLLAVPGRFYNQRTLLAIFHIPGLAISMLRAILKMRAGRREFLHTSKTFTES